VILYVYQGQKVSDKDTDPLFTLRLNRASILNLQLFAAQGYAVIIPSMPRKISSKSFVELPNGVLPALDRAGELGWIDTSRAGVFGHSFGGYSATGLVAQTNKFKVAINHAGPTNWLSYYRAPPLAALSEFEPDSMTTMEPVTRAFVLRVCLKSLFFATFSLTPLFERPSPKRFAGRGFWKWL
jgi:hypothetical protein